MPYIGKQPLTGAYQLCDTITTSATATYNLLVGGSAVIPGSANNCIVSLNGVVQAPVSAFTVSGSTITFASTLSATDVIDFILILGNVFDIGTPTNGAVTNSSLNSNVITGQTAVTVPATDDVLLCYDTSATALRKITFANFGNTPAFQAFLSSSITPTSGVATKMTYQTETYDTDNCYDNSVNYRFTPTVAGKYYVYAKSFLGGSGGNANGLNTYIYKNGAASIYTRHIDVVTSDINSFTGTTSAIMDMNGTTDYVEIFAQATGTGLNFYGDSGGWSNFGAFRIIGA